MNNWRHQKTTFEILARQCINCWLGYILAQPIDIDIVVLGYLFKTYFGVFTLTSYEASNAVYINVSVSEEKKKESFENAII